MRHRVVNTVLLLVGVFLLASCASAPDKHALADDFARTTFPYDDFSHLYRDLHVQGKPVGKDTYEQYIDATVQELIESLSAKELQQALDFYTSPLGQKLLKLGRESRANSVLVSHPDI